LPFAKISPMPSLSGLLILISTPGNGIPAALSLKLSSGLMQE
jgi:hypothetical protein